MISNSLISKNFNKLRQYFNLSQEELGRILSLSRQMISALETETSLPSLDTLDKIRELFNVDIFLFLHGENDFYKKDSNKVQKKTIKDFFNIKNIISF